VLITLQRLPGGFRELGARRNQSESVHHYLRGIRGSNTHGNHHTTKNVEPNACSPPGRLSPDSCESGKTVVGGNRRACRDLDRRISKTSLISPRAGLHPA